MAGVRAGSSHLIGTAISEQAIWPDIPRLDEYFRRKIMNWPVLSPRCARGGFRPQRARR
jgi:hypothetical protein